MAEYVHSFTSAAVAVTRPSAARGSARARARGPTDSGGEITPNFVLTLLIKDH